MKKRVLFLSEILVICLLTFYALNNTEKKQLFEGYTEQILVGGDRQDLGLFCRSDGRVDYFTKNKNSAKILSEIGISHYLIEKDGTVKNLETEWMTAIEKDFAVDDNLPCEYSISIAMENDMIYVLVQRDILYYKDDAGENRVDKIAIYKIEEDEISMLPINIDFEKKVNNFSKKVYLVGANKGELIVTKTLSVEDNKHTTYIIDETNGQKSEKNIFFDEYAVMHQDMIWTMEYRIDGSFIVGYKLPDLKKTVEIESSEGTVGIDQDENSILHMSLGIVSSGDTVRPKERILSSYIVGNKKQQVLLKGGSYKFNDTFWVTSILKNKDNIVYMVCDGSLFKYSPNLTDGK